MKGIESTGVPILQKYIVKMTEDSENESESASNSNSKSVSNSNSMNDLDSED